MKKGWEIRKLGEIADVEYGFTDKSFDDGDYRYVRITDIDGKGELISTEKKYLKYSKEAERFLISNNELLMARTGATFAKVLFFENIEPSVFASYLIRIKFKINLENKLYWYFTKTRYYWEQANNLASGAAQPHFNGTAVKQVIFSYPQSPAEQQRIVAILDEAFAAIDKAKFNAEKNLKNAKELFESYLQGVFEIKGEGWEERRLQDITVIDSPITYGVVKPGMEGEVKFVRGGDLQKGRILVNQLRTISLDISNQYKRTLLKGGELLICLVGMPGQTGIVPIELNGANIARQVGLIRLEKEYSAKFYNYYFQSKQGIKKLGLEESGSVQRVINLAALRNILVPIISISEQQRIVQNLEAFSSETERLVSIYQQKLTDLEELKKSILQKAFNGELNTADICV